VSLRGRHLASVAVLAVLVVLAAVSVRRKEDFDGYVLVGDLVLQGGHVYDDAPPGVSTWPPLFAVVAVPFALLARVSIHAARAAWLAIQLVALLWALRLIVDLVHAKALALRPRAGALTLASAPVLVPLVMASPGVTGNLFHLQVNILVFALVLQGLAWQARGRSWAGGGLVGLAAAVRVMPLVFLPYLLWRRRWRAALAAAVVFLLLSLAPALVFGWETFAGYVGDWLRVADAGWGSGFMNQSLLAAFDRLLDAGPHAARTATLVVLGLLAALALVRFRGPSAPDGRRAIVEWSIVFVVGAIGGPVCWKSYLVVFLLPFAILFAAWRTWEVSRRTRRLAFALLVACLLLTTLPSRDLIGRAAAVRLETASVFTIGALLLVAGLFVLHGRLEEA